MSTYIEENKRKVLEVNEKLLGTEFFQINKHLVKVLSPSESYFLTIITKSQNYAIEKKLIKDDGWFMCTVEYILTQVNINEYEQKKVVNTLKADNVIECKLFGIPARRYIKINHDALLQFIERCKEIRDLQLEVFRDERKKASEKRKLKEQK